MKKTPYIVLLVAEAIIGLICLGQLYSWFGWIGFIAILAAVIGIEAFLVLRLKKQKAGEDEQGMKKTRIFIALALLIPTVIAVAIGIALVVSMLFYFA